VTDIYNSLTPDGIMQLNLQNFFNFFLSTMFWLTYIPFYERMLPIFVGSEQVSILSTSYAGNFFTKVFYAAFLIRDTFFAYFRSTSFPK
jgi:hypothetical protein